jgi:hypothetical protein
VIASEEKESKRISCSANHPTSFFFFIAPMHYSKKRAQKKGADLHIPLQQEKLIAASSESLFGLQHSYKCEITDRIFDENTRRIRQGQQDLRDSLPFLHLFPLFLLLPTISRHLWNRLTALCLLKMISGSF